MNAGRLRHRGTIEHRVPASPSHSESGEALATWQTFAQSWMSIEPLAGRELFASEKNQSEAAVRIRMRYRDGIEATMRVVFGTKYYEIVAVIDPELRHRELELMCSEGVVFAPDTLLVTEGFDGLTQEHGGDLITE